MEFGLKDKRILVTAAASGIGRAIASAFSADGARVHICDIDAAALRTCSADLPLAGASLADVSDIAAVDALFAAVEENLGGLDFLINNAGIAGPTGPVEACAPEEWRRTLAVGLDGTFLCTRRAVPLLKAAGGGGIVNIASTAGILGYPLRSPYDAAKWGVIGLTKSLAMELGEAGIRVNAICPGSVGGERMERVIAAEAKARDWSLDEVRGIYLKHVSLRSFVAAEDIANMVLFVCSDAGARISGQALAVDGHTESLAGKPGGCVKPRKQADERSSGKQPAPRWTRSPP